MSKEIRLALLICDTPIPSVVEEYGDYQKIFTTLLAKSSPAGYTVRLDPFDVREGDYPSDEDLGLGIQNWRKYDGIMITGSKHSAYDDTLEWIPNLVSYVKAVIESGEVRVIGICFGHQIVGRAVGGVCEQDQWEVGLSEIELNDVGKDVFGVDKLMIHQMHRDHVPYPAGVPADSGLQLLGSTQACTNQGMVKYFPPHRSSTKEIHIFTMQGHPEFDQTIVDRILEVRVKAGIIPEELGNQVSDSRREGEPAWKNEGLSVGNVIWRVLVRDT